jgi:tritrans,polycis-undecaprenyl-diphosphate synthase [geranylgeranyl-diphosphate specific]
MDTANLPNHIVIIPDGNRRWARRKGLAPWRGHLVGARTTEELIKAAFDLEIPHLSFWGGSYENLTKRPVRESKTLFQIYERYFRKLAKKKEVHQNQVKVNVFGRWPEILPAKAKQSIKEVIRATQNYNQYLLNFFIAYNGTDEMLEAIKGIVKEAKKGKNFKITSELLKKHLWTADLPPVDFLIRTGSQDDPHNSVGFMMWHTANSQYYFANTMYPDFGRKEFIRAINEYIGRQRRFGK